MTIKIVTPLLLVLLLAPFFAWIASDHFVFMGIDTCDYGVKTVTLFVTLIDEPALWPRTLFSVMKMKLPMMIWLGQFFVPLGYLIHSVPRALVFSIVVTQLASLSLLYLLLKKVFEKRSIAYLGCLVLASAPLFIDMSIRYLVEPLHLLTVLWFVYCAVTASERDRLTNFLHLIIATTFAMLVKISSPVYCTGPALVILWHAVRPHPSQRQRKSLEYLALSVVAVLLVYLAGHWYEINWESLYRLRWNSVFCLWAGNKRPFFDKAFYWFGAFTENLFAPHIIFAVIPLLIAGLWLFAKKKRSPKADMLLFVSVAQILLFVSAASCVVNECPRYLLPLFPYGIFLICWSLSTINRTWVSAAACAVFLYQYALVYVPAFHHVKKETFSCLFEERDRNVRGMKTYRVKNEVIDKVIDATRIVGERRRARIMSVFAYYYFGRYLNFYELCGSRPPELYHYLAHEWQPFHFRKHALLKKHSKEKTWEAFLSQRPLYYLDLDLDDKMTSDGYFCQILGTQPGLQRQYEYSLYIREKIETSGLFTRVPLPDHPEVLLYAYRGEHDTERKEPL